MLDSGLIQLREGRWVFADLIGKRGRVRTVAIPLAAKDALDEWTCAAGIISGPVFRRMRKGGSVTGLALSAWAIWDVVRTAAKAAGIGELGPHDLRRYAESRIMPNNSNRIAVVSSNLDCHAA